MRYRRLARSLRQALAVPAPLPLEWLLSDEAPAALTQDTALLPLIPAFRRKIADYLSGFRTQAALSRDLARKLGIEPCPFSRRSLRRPPARRARDLAADAALLDRRISNLSAKIRANLPLSPPERRALACLRALGIPLA